MIINAKSNNDTQCKHTLSAREKKLEAVLFISLTSTYIQPMSHARDKQREKKLN